MMDKFMREMAAKESGGGWPGAASSDLKAGCRCAQRMHCASACTPHAHPRPPRTAHGQRMRPPPPPQLPLRVLRSPPRSLAAT